MKKFFTLFAAALMALSMTAAPALHAKADKVANFAANAQKRAMGAHHAPAQTTDVVVIEDQPAGKEVTYVRTGGQAFLYDYDEENVSLVYSSGTVSVVFGANNTVYMKNPIFDNEFDTWIAGTTNADSTLLTFPMGQYIVFADDYGYGIQIYAGALNASGTGFNRNTAITSFSYSIDKAAGTMSLNDFVDINSILGLFYSDDATWAAGGEFLSTFETTIVPSTDPIVPPVGLQTETWNVNGQEEDEDYQLIDFEEYTVELGFDGSDVYVKGISVDFPDAWIKGTVAANGDITFDNNIYLGEMYGYDMFFVGYNYTSQAKAAPVFTYDAATQSYSTEDGIVINADPFKLYYWQWMDNVVISKSAQGIENASSIKASKALVNGQVRIVRGAKAFNVLGAEL